LELIRHRAGKKACPKRFFSVNQASMALTANLKNLHATRRSLLSRIKNPNDQESWKVFFDTYSRLVYSVAMKAGLSHTEADDVVQETFVLLTKKMPEFKYDPEKSFKGWLIHTAQFKILDQLRKRKGRFVRSRSSTRESRTPTIERIADPAPLSLEVIFEGEWREHIFSIALGRVKQQVTASQYQIFDLYVLKKWPVEKVASTLGINNNRVYLAKHRVSQLIMREVKSLEAEPDPKP
jgi:RNA polymerase sigma factor (sigma-70 family)